MGTLKHRLFSFAIAITAPILTSALVQAEQIDPNTGEGYVSLNRKFQCSLKDNEETTFTFEGNAYARIAGQRDTHLFQLMGMNIRKCVTVNDKDRGAGYRLVSREIMLYLDPKTGEVLREWKNPFTGETNEVIHVANDPVNSRPSYGFDKDGNEQRFGAKFIDDTYFMSIEVPLFYSNPLGGNYQKYIGGTYHGTEIFHFSGKADELLDTRTDIEYAKIAWVRIADWLPWMEMGGRHGTMYFSASGKKLERFDDLPETMLKEIAENYPEYKTAPPADDTRPNETSWTYMKKIIDARAEPAEQSSH